MSTRLEKLKSDPRVRYVAELSGGRHIVEISLSDINVDDKLKKIRGTQPKSIALLKSSIKDISDGDTLYTISLYMPDDDGEPSYFIGDGLQRYNALKGNGETKTFAQVVLKWRNLEEAMAACLSANFARYPMDEHDVFSVMDAGLLTDREIMKLTPFQESTVARIRKVHEVKWLRELVDRPKLALGYSKAAALVSACGKDESRFAALETEILAIEETAQQNADFYEQQGRTQKLHKSDAKKAKLKFWFDAAKDKIESIKSCLENGDIEQDADGVWHVTDSTAGKKVAATVGLPNEWETRVAVNHFFSKKWDELTLADIQKVRNALPQIGEYLDCQISRILATEVKREFPMRASGDKFVDSETEPVVSEPPIIQQPSATVENN